MDQRQERSIAKLFNNYFNLKNFFNHLKQKNRDGKLQMQCKNMQSAMTFLAKNIKFSNIKTKIVVKTQNQTVI